MEVLWKSLALFLIIFVVINGTPTEKAPLKCFVGRAGELPHMENCTDHLVSQTLKSMPLANYSYKFKKNMGEFACVNLDAVSVQADPPAKKNYLGCAHADYDPCNWTIQTAVVKSTCHTCTTNLCNGGWHLAASLWSFSAVFAAFAAVLKRS